MLSLTSSYRTISKLGMGLRKNRSSFRSIISQNVPSTYLFSTSVNGELTPTIEHPAYEIINSSYVKEYSIHTTLYRHIKSGAEIMSVVAPDDNKVFGVNFRTPPTDSTGLPHILEHSVLCGSRKYPSKEPFVDLLKGSLNTFLNAFTYPDRTCYPVASVNLKDFYNLAHVYMDAVLCKLYIYIYIYIDVPILIHSHTVCYMIMSLLFYRSKSCYKSSGMSSHVIYHYLH